MFCLEMQNGISLSGVFLISGKNSRIVVRHLVKCFVKNLILFQKLNATFERLWPATAGDPPFS